MKKSLLFLCVCIMQLCVVNVFAQDAKNHRQAMMDQRREYIKTNFTVSKSSEEAFWQAYDKYTADEMQAYKEQHAMKAQAKIPHHGDTTALTDEQILEKYRIKFLTKHKLLTAEETFFNTLKKVLSPKELESYYKVERKFLRSAVDNKEGMKKQK